MKRTTVRRVTSFLAAFLLAAGAVLATSASARAVQCGSGNDHYSEGDMAWHDSSWANHGISGPGVKDHVEVYEYRELLGSVTICLAPGQEVGYSASANDKGASHTWTMGR